MAAKRPWGAAVSGSRAQEENEASTLWLELLAGVGFLTVAQEPSHWGTGDCSDLVAPWTAVLPLPLPHPACKVTRGRAQGGV